MITNLRYVRKVLQFKSEIRLAAFRNFVTPASRSTKSSNDKLNEPVQYFGSEAALWRARSTQTGGADDVPWYQPFVVTGSVAIFMIYFCILREENDIDKKLEGSLFDQVSGLEEIQLKLVYKQNKQNGLSTTEIEKRLAELGVDINTLDEVE